MRGSTTSLPVRERRFYLEQFGGRTLVIGRGPGSDGDAEVVDRLVAGLVAEDVRVVLIEPGGRVAHWQPDDAGVVAAWRQLHRHGQMRVRLPAEVDHLTLAVRLAVRLQAFKVVLVDEGHDRTASDRDAARAAAADSFITLREHHRDGRLGKLAGEALDGGVATVNVCHPRDIAEELLSYAGAGTCYTRSDYTTVRRVAIDEYAVVAELIERGVEESFLKARSPDAVARLVVNGWGAYVGDHHLAGFAALLTEPYAAEGLGELSALTTISRFVGGGVGGRLVEGILRAAVVEGLQGVFACTTSESAATFFRRLGFVDVPQTELPQAKWDGYDAERRPRVRAFMHLLTMIEGGPPTGEGS